jgi:murein DD-endopeptidase MepM/ murein hydrolase activator NlpD
VALIRRAYRALITKWIHWIKGGTRETIIPVPRSYKNNPRSLSGQRRQIRPRGGEPQVFERRKGQAVAAIPWPDIEQEEVGAEVRGRIQSRERPIPATRVRPNNALSGRSPRLSGIHRLQISRRVLLGLVLLLGLVTTWNFFPTAPTATYELSPPLLSVARSGSLPPLRWRAGSYFTHRVEAGQSLAAIFSRYGFDSTEAKVVDEALKKLDPSEKFAKLKTRQEIEFRLQSNGRISRLVTSADPQSIVVVRREGSGYTAELEKVESKSQERVVSGSIQSSFAQAASNAGLPYAAIDEFVDLFADRISFHRDFRKGDQFSLVYKATVLDDGSSVGTGTILAASIEVAGEIFHAVRYVGADGVARYFDAKGDLLGTSFLRYPLKFSRISSLFDTARFHPVLKRRRPHNGVDFAAPIGTPIRSVADGIVEIAGRRGGSGIMLKIRHSDRYSTAYLHLNNIAKGIRAGSSVQRGQVIGAVGTTGLSTGPHLHYSLYDRGKYVDPLKAKLPTIENLSKGQRVDPIYLRRVLFTLEHYRGRQLEIAQVMPVP